MKGQIITPLQMKQHGYEDVELGEDFIRTPYNTLFFTKGKGGMSLPNIQLGVPFESEQKMGRAPFGASNYEDNADKTKKNCEISIPEHNSEKITAVFAAFEDRLINQVFENRSKFFTANVTNKSKLPEKLQIAEAMTIEDVKLKFKSSITPADGSFTARIFGKMETGEGKNAVAKAYEIINRQLVQRDVGSVVNDDSIGFRGSRCVFVIEPGPVWVKSTGFWGFYWRVVMVCFKKASPRKQMVQNLIFGGADNQAPSIITLDGDQLNADDVCGGGESNKRKAEDDYSLKVPELKRQKAAQFPPFIKSEPNGAEGDKKMDMVDALIGK